jgi:pseudaminic acid cytidylyltransferase
MKIAIIPARLNSKRIKKKNIKLFYSKPIIFWTIKKLIKSNFFDKIVVSSDSSLILALSKKFGADILIKRSKNLSGDKILTKDVILESIKKLNKKNINPKYVCCVYPCNPFLNIKDIKKAFSLLKNGKNKFIFPVTKYSHPIQRALKLDKKLNISPFILSNINERTQDLKDFYYDVGQFYWGSVNLWNGKDSIHKFSKGLVIPSWRVVDIDTIDDWNRAELMYRLMNSN